MGDEKFEEPVVRIVAMQLRAERGVLRLDERQMAQKAGIALEDYCAMEEGGRVDLHSLLAVLRVFELDLNEFLARAERRLPNPPAARSIVNQRNGIGNIEKLDADEVHIEVDNSPGEEV